MQSEAVTPAKGERQRAMHELNDVLGRGCKQECDICDDGERCQDCGSGNNGLLWHAPQPLWDLLQRRQGGLLCPPCFNAKAESTGYRLRWVPVVTALNGEATSNWWHNETFDWLLMGQPDPDFPDRSEHPVWATVRDALEVAGWPQPPMDFYPPENFRLPSRSNPDAGYHKLDWLANVQEGSSDK